MNARTIHEFLTSLGISDESVSMLDSEYLLPSRQWIASEFGTAFETLKQNLGTSGYVPNVNDCDDFSLLAHWYAQHLHRLSAPESGAGIAFGTFTYIKDSGEVHSVNVAITGESELTFFEPQTSQIVALNENEIFLCSEVRL